VGHFKICEIVLASFEFVVSNNIGFPVKGGAPQTVELGCIGLIIDDVTGVEKSCIAKGINEKKQRKNILLLPMNMRFPQTSNAWMFAMFQKFMHSQLLKLIFLSPNRCETQISKSDQTS